MVLILVGNLLIKVNLLLDNELDKVVFWLYGLAVKGRAIVLGNNYILLRIFEKIYNEVRKCKKHHSMKVLEYLINFSTKINLRLDK